MYLNHFGLSQSPFKITPNTGFFYTGGNRGAILEALLYAIVNGEGIIKVTGEIGSGKTMICRTLESRFPQNVVAIYLANPSLNRDDVFYVIAAELGLPTDRKHANEILRLLQNTLIEMHATGKQVVLLVEEAQAMPLDTLEEIRLLSNLETSHHKLLQIVLFGQPELNNNLALPSMRQLRERITHSFSLPPLTSANIQEYLLFRLRVAGYRGPDLFHPGSIKLITATSQGITRRINVLADKALLAAFSKNTHHILTEHIHAAIKDSEFGVPRRALPLKNIGLALLLLALGVALGAGWQQLAKAPDHSTPLKAAGPPPSKATVAAKPLPLDQTINPDQAPLANRTEHEPELGPSRSHPPNPEPPLDRRESSPATGVLQERLAATSTWLAGSEDSRYTIQLMVATNNSPTQLEKFLDKVSNSIELGQIYIYPTHNSADNQFNITFGDFPSRAQALVALAQLPATYQANHPFLQTTKGIREEMAK
jgi:type II secretory pathway predicted ATPase ExeA